MSTIGNVPKTLTVNSVSKTSSFSIDETSVSFYIYDFNSRIQLEKP